MSATSFVDLHCHSTASDGTLPPREVVRLAKERGLTALALTDHDTIAGIADAWDEAAKIGIDFLAGIEISSAYAPGTMHLLGYGIDATSPVLLDMTKTLIGGRDDRNPKIVAKLNAAGVHITMDEVIAEARSRLENPNDPVVIGRPHIAAILLRKGYVKNNKQAFDEYLAPGGKAYVDKERITSSQALQMIRDSGGLPVLAHPVQLRTENDAQLETIVKNLCDEGLAGIECIHSDHSPELRAKYEALADRYHLLKTGGSDFHGQNKPKIDLGLAAGVRVPRAWFDALMSAAQAAYDQINR